MRDGLGRIVSVNNSWEDKIQQTIMRYNDQGQLSQVDISGQPSKIFRYDALGRRTEWVGEMSWQFDVADRLIKQKEKSGRQLILKWDHESRLTDKYTLLGNNIHVKQSYAYDKWGRLLTYTDERGGIYRHEWSDDVSLLTVTDSLGRKHRTSIDWMEDGRRQVSIVEAFNSVLPAATKLEENRYAEVEKVIAPSGAETDFLYDDFGRKIIENSADRGRYNYTYNNANSLKEISFGKVKFNLMHDLWGRLIQQKVIENGIDLPEFSEVRHYQGMNLIATDSAVQRESYSYDERGYLSNRFLKIQLAPSKAIAWSMRKKYDLSGNLLRQELLDGSILNYERLQDGRLSRVMRTSNGHSEVLLDEVKDSAFGITDYRFINGEKYHSLYDSIGQLKQFSYSHPVQKNNWERRYTYDVFGRINAMYPIANYHYDPLNHLVEAKITSELSFRPETDIFDYQYDSAGRRMSDNGHLNHYQEKTHRWLGDVSNNSNYSVSYDDFGRLVREGKREYIWNAIHQLSEVRDNKKSVVNYTYSPSGVRVLKSLKAINGKIVHQAFIYSDGYLVGEASFEEHNAAWNIKSLRQYIYIDGRLMIILDDNKPKWEDFKFEDSVGKTVSSHIVDLFFGVINWFSALFKASSEHLFFVESDHLGTPIVVRDKNTQQVWKASYAPFGDADVSAHNGFNLNVRFPGQYYDEETGLHYNYYRYYDPKRGEYLTPDPIGLAGGINLYGYVFANPVNKKDILGLDVYVANTSQVLGMHQKIVVDTPTGPYGQSFGLPSRNAPMQGFSEAYGISPNQGQKGSGEVYRDDDPITKIQRRIITTAEQDILIKQYLEKQIGNTGPYNVGSNSCRSYSNREFDNIVKKFNLKDNSESFNNPFLWGF